MNSETLSKQHETKSVADLVHLYEKEMLELSPTFQRKSVWALKDRRKLMETVFRNYPLPAIFLYRNEEAEKLSYAVIDGKQRLETLLGFLGHLRGESFEMRVEVPGFEGTQLVSAKSLKHKKLHRERLWPRLMSYRIPVIEVSGSLSDIIEVFVRINSTGKPLTSQERRKAKYSGSNFLVQATSLADRLAPYWEKTGVISKQKMARMKHVEFAAELLLTVNVGDVINKKAAVDKVMLADSITSAQLKKDRAKVESAVKRVERMFPDLRTTRFKQLVDYYSLVEIMAELERNGAVLTDKKRNRLAWDLLTAFSVEVDLMREQQRKLLATKPETEIYRDYLLTVSQMTDDVSQRRRRKQILLGLIGSLFAKKDEQRSFSVEQRRILWNSQDERKCENCRDPLSWSNFTIDHVDPHSKGGRSSLENAALMCRSCNSAKGNRGVRKRKSASSSASRN